ncbi:MAG: sugar phosphate isomerase/epimerase [Chloroflexota bacterium]|nr:sugar phosphate isomerase/epimerase [Chloroflexota bacterium]
MQICLRTHMVSDDPAVRVDYCRQIGIGAVQESAKSIPGAVERGWPTAAELREYRRPFDEAGIAIVGLEPVREPVRDWVEDTPAGRESFEVFARHLDAAGAAGLPCVTLHPPLDGARSPEETAEQFRLNCEFYARASERARQAGTKLATHSPWPPAKGLWGAREYDSLFDAVPAPENGMIFCFGCLAMSGDDVREVMPRFIDRTFMVHVRDVVIHPDGRVDEVFPGTGQVRPDTAIKLLHELGYRGAIAPEHLPQIFGERKNEIAMAWAVGYCRAALAGLT